MTLLHATMIAGLAAVVLPLLLQRIGRTRVRSVDWGAMMFLTDSPVVSLGSSSAREWLLLLIRMGMIATLALALAQPVLSDATAANGPGLTVIVIDRSGSMSVTTGDKTRLDLARRAALNVLASLPSGDEAAVIFSPEAFGSAITSDFQQIAARITDIRQSSARADLAGALNTAARLINASHATRRNLFLIADRQASSFRDLDDTFARNYRTGLGTSPTNLRFIPIGDAADNCAVMSVDPIDPQIIAGRAFPIDIKVANFSNTQRNNLPVSIALGEQTIDQSTMDVSPGGTAATRRFIRLPTVGSNLLTIRIGEDAYTADDSMDLAVLVQPTDATPHAPPDQNLSPGDPIVADLPGASPDHITVDGPNGGAADIATSAGSVQARFSATGRPGVYRLHYQSPAGPQTLHFVVRAPREESDLAPLSRSSMNDFMRRFGFVSLADSSTAAVARELNPPHLEPWMLLLTLVVGLALIEAALSRYWLALGHGALA